MTHYLSPICQQAKIIDLENKAVFSYAEAYNPEIYKYVSMSAPLHEYRASHKAAQPVHSSHTPYLICWEQGRTAFFLTRKAPHQIKPEEVEALYYKASSLKPIKLGD
ncbi:MAG: hypothetical protein ACKO0Z_25780 [Betaproteobacteria bacterium]